MHPPVVFASILATSIRMMDKPHGGLFNIKYNADRTNKDVYFVEDVINKLFKRCLGISAFLFVPGCQLLI